MSAVTFRGGARQTCTRTDRRVQGGNRSQRLMADAWQSPARAGNTETLTRRDACTQTHSDNLFSTEPNVLCWKGTSIFHRRDNQTGRPSHCSLTTFLVSEMRQECLAKKQNKHACSRWNSTRSPFPLPPSTCPPDRRSLSPSRVCCPLTPGWQQPPSPHFSCTYLEYGPLAGSQGSALRRANDPDPLLFTAEPAGLLG